MADLFIRNSAVDINDPTGLDFHITSHGSDWLWAAFAVMIVCFLGSLGVAYTKGRTERIFHYLCALGVFIMSIAYFTMASDLGWAGVKAEFSHITVAHQSTRTGVRQVFYSRYVAWFLSFPCVFLNFASYVGVGWATALFTIACQWVTVLTLLIGSVIVSTYKWGYFTFACVGFLLVSYNFLFPFRRAAERNGVLRNGLTIACSSVLLLVLYPVCWALSEGGNVIQPDSEVVFYGVLDVLYFVAVSSTLLYFSRNQDFVKRNFATCESPVFHRHGACNPLPAEKVAESKEGVLDRHSGETAADAAAHAAAQV